jgi:hypothetical protein
LLSIGAPDLAKGQANPPSAALHLDDVQFAGEQIRLSFRALDALGQAAKLDAKQLVVRQDGVPIPADRIELLPWVELGEHIAVALVLDPALASDPDTRPWVDTALAGLASALSGGDRVALVSPGERSSGATFTSAKQLATLKLSEAPDRQHGGGAIRDALYRAATALRDSGDLPRRKVVIAISAGPDLGSAHSVDDVIAAALGKPDGSRPFTPIYAIARAPAKGEDLADLERLSRGTEGDLFLFESAVHLPSLLVAAAHPFEAGMVAVVRPELDGAAHEIELAWNDLTASVKMTYPRGSHLLVRLGITLLPLVALGWATAIWLGRKGRHGRIIFVAGPEPGRTISLRPGQLRIGALSQNDIVIDSESASRRHAELRITADAVEIEDLDSENGTLVNDEPIQVRALQPGDRIRIGDVELVYQK